MYNNRQLPIPKRNSSLAVRKRADDDSPLLKKVIFSSLLGLGATVLSGILLVSLVTFIAYSSSDPLSLIPPLSLLALLPSNFLGGFISAKRCGESALACGCVTASMWGILSLIGALCLISAPSSSYALWQGILLHGSSLAFCILGALAGGIKRKPSRKKRRFG